MSIVECQAARLTNAMGDQHGASAAIIVTNSSQFAANNQCDWKPDSTSLDGNRQRQYEDTSHNLFQVRNNSQHGDDVLQLVTICQ